MGLQGGAPRPPGNLRHSGGEARRRCSRTKPPSTSAPTSSSSSSILPSSRGAHEHFNKKGELVGVTEHITAGRCPDCNASYESVVTECPKCQAKKPEWNGARCAACGFQGQVLPEGQVALPVALLQAHPRPVRRGDPGRKPGRQVQDHRRWARLCVRWKPRAGSCCRARR